MLGRNFTRELQWPAGTSGGHTPANRGPAQQRTRVAGPSEPRKKNMHAHTHTRIHIHTQKRTLTYTNTHKHTHTHAYTSITQTTQPPKRTMRGDAEARIDIPRVTHRVLEQKIHQLQRLPGRRRGVVAREHAVQLRRQAAQLADAPLPPRPRTLRAWAYRSPTARQ